MEMDFNDGCKKEKKKRVKDILESREGARWKKWRDNIWRRAPLDNINLRRFLN